MTIPSWATNATYSGLTGAAAAYNGEPTKVAPPDRANGLPPTGPAAAEHINYLVDEMVQTANADIAEAFIQTAPPIFQPAQAPVVPNITGTGLRWGGCCQAAGRILYAPEVSSSQGHAMASRMSGFSDWGEHSSTLSSGANSNGHRLCAGPAGGGKVLWATGTVGTRAVVSWDNDPKQLTGQNRVELDGTAEFGGNETRACVYDPINARYMVLTAATGGAGTVYTSATAAASSWTSRNPGMSVNPDDIACHKTTGRVMLVGRSATTGIVAYAYSSNGGTSWTAGTFTGNASALTAVFVDAHPDGFSCYVRVGTGVQVFLFDEDTLAWGSAQGASLTITTTVVHRRQFACNQLTGRMIVSTEDRLFGSVDNGVTWTSLAPSTAHAGNGVEELGRGFLIGRSFSLESAAEYTITEGALSGL